MAVKGKDLFCNTDPNCLRLPVFPDQELLLAQLLVSKSDFIDKKLSEIFDKKIKQTSCLKITSRQDRCNGCLNLTRKNFCENKKYRERLEKVFVNSIYNCISSSPSLNKETVSIAIEELKHENRVISRVLHSKIKLSFERINRELKEIDSFKIKHIIECESCQILSDEEFHDPSPHDKDSHDEDCACVIS